MLDRLLLALERLGLVSHVFGQRVQRRETLFGALAQFVEARQRAQFVFDLFHGRHGRGHVLAGFARALADLGEVLGKCGGQRAHLIEFALECRRLPDRLLDVGIGLLQLGPEFFECGPLLFQRLERRLGAKRLRRQVLYRLTMLLQFAVRTDGFLGGLFRLAGRVFQLLDALVDFRQLLRPVVERGQALGDLVKLCGDTRGLLGHLLERFSEWQQLGALGGQRAHHRADGAPLFPGRDNQLLEAFGLLLRGLAFAAGDILEGVQHVRTAPGLRRNAREYGPVRVSALTGISITRTSRYRQCRDEFLPVAASPGWHSLPPSSVPRP